MLYYCCCCGYGKIKYERLTRKESKTCQLRTDVLNDNRRAKSKHCSLKGPWPVWPNFLWPYGPDFLWPCRQDFLWSHKVTYSSSASSCVPLLPVSSSVAIQSVGWGDVSWNQWWIQVTGGSTVVAVGSHHLWRVHECCTGMKHPTSIWNDKRVQPYKAGQTGIKILSTVPYIMCSWNTMPQVATKSLKLYNNA